MKKTLSSALMICFILCLFPRGGYAQTVLRFQIIDGYMMVSGNVNGVQGFFMIDTGTPTPFFINNHYIPLANNRVVGHGQAGSGQQLTIGLTDSLHIMIDGVKELKNQMNVMNAGFDFIEEGICPQFLGFIGYAFFENKPFVLNYADKTLTIYEADENLPIDKTNYKCRAVLDFTTSEQSPQLPLVACRLGGHKLQAFFDTGTSGQLKISRSLRQKLTEKGTLVGDSAFVEIKGLKIKNLKASPLYNIHCTEDDSNQIGLGYEFLRNYLTVWNYHNRTLEVWERIYSRPSLATDIR